MPAIDTDIGPGTRRAVTLSWTSATIQSRYPSARDGLAEPAEGFFDTAANAQTAIDARGALIGTERRRFTVPVQDLIWPDPTSGMLTVTLIDTEQNVNGNTLVARIEVDLEAERSTLETFG